MAETVKIGDKLIGTGQPVYLIGEIGINHNGDMDVAKKLIDISAESGFDAVKFQKRTPELCVPKEQRDVMRETPWGLMSYMDYRYKVEFSKEQYQEIDSHCKERGIHWFASCWDVDSVDFMEEFSPVCYKIASASVTDFELLNKLHETGKPMILSTGMSTIEEIQAAVDVFDKDKLVVAHSTSSYPCPPEEINLNMIPTLSEMFDVPVGYSGHEIGIQISIAAAALGACLIERHITVDRAMWGSDQAASVEPQGMKLLARDVRVIEQALGDGVKKVYESEMTARQRLRKTA